MIPAAATAVGSMPGTSTAEATAVVVGELPDFPHLPELPARGPGADLIGRTGALLAAVSADFGIETDPLGWRRSGAVGPQMRRARSWLGEDLDRLQEALGDSPGVVKVQVCGPWTWAAGVTDTGGNRLVKDPGFVEDLAACAREAFTAHARDAARRLPGRSVVLQVDEPSLPALLAGAIPTASGLGRLAAVAPGDAAAVLRQAADAGAAATVLHSCADLPFAVARAAGFAGVSFDAEVVAPGDDVAETVEAGVRLIVGALPTTAAADPRASWTRLHEWWRRCGLDEAGLRQIAVSPACGLAGVTDPVRILTAVREVAGRAADAGD